MEAEKEKTNLGKLWFCHWLCQVNTQFFTMILLPPLTTWTNRFAGASSSWWFHSSYLMSCAADAQSHCWQAQGANGDAVRRGQLQSRFAFAAYRIKRIRHSWTWLLEKEAQVLGDEGPKHWLFVVWHRREVQTGPVAFSLPCLVHLTEANSECACIHQTKL